jgi:hypothetical protein
MLDQVVTAARTASAINSRTIHSVRLRLESTAASVRPSIISSNSVIGPMIASLSSWYRSSCMIRRANAGSGSPSLA